MREQDIRSRRFEFDEMRRKLRDLNDLKVQIEASLDRLPQNGLPGAYPGMRDGDEAGQRRETLEHSLQAISREIEETRALLDTSREEIERQENAYTGYDRIPVAVGSRRGRGQVEHIRIVRSQRS